MYTEYASIKLRYFICAVTPNGQSLVKKEIRARSDLLLNISLAGCQSLK